jgi:hypothetical protein
MQAAGPDQEFLQDVPGASVGPCEVVELANADEYTRARDVAEHHRRRDVVHHRPEAENAGCELHHAYIQGQRERDLHRCGAQLHAQRGDRSTDEQAHGIGRTSHHVTRAAEQAADDGGKDGGVEARGGRKTGNQRVRHALGHRSEGDHECCLEVSSNVRAGDGAEVDEWEERAHGTAGPGIVGAGCRNRAAAQSRWRGRRDVSGRVQEAHPLFR